MSVFITNQSDLPLKISHMKEMILISMYIIRTNEQMLVQMNKRAMLDPILV